ncbi:hypothetical protein GP486_008898, partial [Trichoglossum hirsutum]
LGLGAPVPKEFADGDVKKQKEFILNDKIRRRMMGGRSSDLPARPQDQRKGGPSAEGAGASTSRSIVGRATEAEAEADSDNESRSSLWKTKRPKDAPAGESVSGGCSSTAVTSSRERPSTKRRINFLDEFLLEKSEKKKKKRKGNKEDE